MQSLQINCPACCGFGIAACCAKERVRTLASTCYDCARGITCLHPKPGTRPPSASHRNRYLSARVNSPNASALFNTSRTLHLPSHQPIRFEFRATLDVIPSKRKQKHPRRSYQLPVASYQLRGVSRHWSQATLLLVFRAGHERIGKTSVNMPRAAFRKRSKRHDKRHLQG